MAEQNTREDLAKWLIETIVTTEYGNLESTSREYILELTRQVMAAIDFKLPVPFNSHEE
jgi:hypothetical protein